MLLQSYSNKREVITIGKIDKLYRHSESTILLQRSKNYFIEYNNKIFPNNSHLHLRACDFTSSYHCPYLITESNIPQWYCIFNCCYNFPRMND